MGITNDRVRQILDGLDLEALVQLIKSRDVEEDERPRIVLSAISRLEALFYDRLAELVVDACVTSTEETARPIRHQFLSPWLKREGYHQRRDVIAHLIRWLQTGKDTQLVAAIRTASAVGYRDDSLVSELIRIAGVYGKPNNNNDAQGYALAALASMAFEDPRAIARTLEARLKRIGVLSEPDCWTAMYVAPRSMISNLREAAKLNTFAVNALLEIVSRDAASAFDVWRAFESLSNDVRFLYFGSVVDRIDLEVVAHYLLSDVFAALQSREHRNMLPLFTRVLEANLPNHIQVFRTAGHSLTAEQLKAIKLLAVTPTGNKTNFHTVESLNKEAVWNIILRLGLDKARRWLPEAMKGEFDFTFAKLGELAGFLQVYEAVDLLASVVRREGVDIVLGISSLQSLGVIGTSDALNALMESKVRFEDNENGNGIPMALVEALGSVCMSLRSTTRIWNTLKNPSENQQLRKVCAHVIEDLSSFVEPPLPPVYELIDLLSNEGPTLPGYDSALLSLWGFKGRPEVMSFLRELGNSEYQSPKLTQVLAITGLLNEFPNRIETLGLHRTGEGWVFDKAVDDVSAFAVLWLYRGDPRFEPAIIQILNQGLFGSATQIVTNLKSTDQISERVREALWKRALRLNGANFSDRSVLEAVARVWPEMLLQQSTLEEVSRWNTYARRSYVAALRTAFKEGANPFQVSQMACHFLADGDSDVRRDAARLASDSDPAVLLSAVEAFRKNSGELDQAIFMLEAAFWLEPSSQFETVGTVGRTHREPVVRDLTRRLDRERNDVTLAHAYLAQVLRSTDYLKTWCYGQALLDLGNEETIDQIYSALPSEVYRRSYLIWLAKELEKGVEKRRRDQLNRTELPPPASHQVSVNVTVRLRDEQFGPFPGVLQEVQSRRAHRWVSSWSIRVENEPELAQRLAVTASNEEIYIETANGQHGRVVPVCTVFGSGEDGSVARVLMLGQGELNNP